MSLYLLRPKRSVDLIVRINVYNNFKMILDVSVRYRNHGRSKHSWSEYFPIVVIRVKFQRRDEIQFLAFGFTPRHLICWPENYCRLGSRGAI
jgi:hypothetical protein